MNKSELFTYLEGLSAASSHNTPIEIALNILVVLMLMLFILLVYRVVHNKNLAFNSNFGFVILLSGLVTSTIMMTIENNLALSLGMVGALSIVRFRSAIKDPKDTAFIFWAVAEGLCAGTGNYVLAVVSSLLLGAAVMVYTALSAGNMLHLLVVRVSAPVYDDVINCFKSNRIRHSVKLKNVSAGGAEYIFKINAKGNANIVEKLKAIEGVVSVSLAYEGEQ